jgi:hypothetical protein
MLGPLQFFNALVVRLKQKPEGYCSVLDILVSLMTPALGVEFGGVLILSNRQTELASENFEIMPGDNLAVVGTTDFF